MLERIALWKESHQGCVCRFGAGEQQHVHDMCFAKRKVLLLEQFAVGPAATAANKRLYMHEMCPQGEQRCDACAEFVELYNGTCAMK